MGAAGSSGSDLRGLMWLGVCFCGFGILLVLGLSGCGFGFWVFGVFVEFGCGWVLF